MNILTKIQRGALVPLQQAVLAIQQETDPQKLADLNKALEAAKKLDNKNRQHANHWGTLAIFSAKQLGQAIKQGQEQGTIATKGQPQKEIKGRLLLLSDIVPSQDYAQRCYRLMDIPDETIWEYQAKCDEDDEQVTKVGAMRYAADPNLALKTTGNEEWYTPSVYIEAARKVMGSIDLDPASCEHAQETVQAAEYYTVDDDGLAQEWSGNVWMNPPFTALVVNKFVDKLVASYQAGQVHQAIMLTNNATDTTWFHAAMDAECLLCLTRGRIAFEACDGKVAAPTNGQAFFYFGNRHKTFTSKFSEFGRVLHVA